jgi:hypothetical protein
MALLTAQQITKAGLAPVYSAVSASDTIAVDSVGMFLHVKNAGGTADTVTLDDSGTTAGGSAATDPTVTVPITTGDRMIYLPPSFTNSATGLVTVTHSFTTSVTCALLRVV